MGRLRYRVWKREDGLWCVSPDRGDNTRRAPVILARTLDKACERLKQRQDRRVRNPNRPSLALARTI